MKTLRQKTGVLAATAMGALLLSLSPTGGQGLGDATFKVNCDKGNQTVQAALDKASGGLPSRCRAPVRRM